MSDADSAAYLVPLVCNGLAEIKDLDVTLFGDGNAPSFADLVGESGEFNISGFYDDAEPTITIEPLAKPKRGGNQHAKWLAFQGRVTFANGRSEEKTIRMMESRDGE